MTTLFLEKVDETHAIQHWEDDFHPGVALAAVCKTAEKPFWHPEEDGQP